MYQIEVCSWCLCGNITELIFPSVVPLSLSTLAFLSTLERWEAQLSWVATWGAKSLGINFPLLEVQACCKHVWYDLPQHGGLFFCSDQKLVLLHNMYLTTANSLKPLLIQNADGASRFSRSWGYPSFSSWATGCFIWKTTCSLVLAMTSEHWTLARWPWCSSIPLSTGSSL